MNKVTIVIPCYNQAQYLPDAIESALDQTVPCEVIVVNDGSPDNTSEVAKRFDVKLIEKENGGLPSARNAGIKEATGDWILTLDSDDIITSDFVEKCLKKAEEGYDIIGTFQHEFGDSETKWANNNLTPGFEDFKKANQINCCSLYKKEIWDIIGGYDENMKLGYEDWDFWMRATSKGCKVAIIPEFLFYYRKHGQTMISNTVKYHEPLKQYMLKKHESRS